jgi:hypothetical protein
MVTLTLLPLGTLIRVFGTVTPVAKGVKLVI